MMHCIIDMFLVFLILPLLQMLQFKCQSWLHEPRLYIREGFDCPNWLLNRADRCIFLNVTATLLLDLTFSKRLLVALVRLIDSNVMLVFLDGV